MMSSVASFHDPGMREMDFGVEGNGSCLDSEPRIARPGASRLFFHAPGHGHEGHSPEWHGTAHPGFHPRDGKGGIFTEQIRAR